MLATNPEAAMQNAATHAIPGNANDDIEILQQLNRGYVRAAETSDVKWYDQHLDADYMSSGPDGSLIDRAAFLTRIARPYPGSELEARDVRIRVVGELGIIQSGFRHRQADGRMGTGWYTDVWSRRRGHWLCIAAHFVLPAVRPAGGAVQKRVPVQGTGADVEALEELNLNFIRSVQASDAGWFERHLDADFVNTNADGSLSERAAFISFIARPCAVRELRCEDVCIQMHGDSAVIHARTAYVKPDEQPGAGRYIDVWMRRDGRWRCVSAHVTRG